MNRDLLTEAPHFAACNDPANPATPAAGAVPAAGAIYRRGDAERERGGRRGTVD